MDASSTSVGRGTLLQVQAVPRDVTIPGQTPGAAAVRRRHGDPPAQAHGGRGGAPEHALRESGRAGARHGTEVSRVPGGPQTGRAGGPALHDEPGRADLSSEGGASGGDPKGSPGLAATLPEVESKPCHYADPAQPGSGEERGRHLEAPPPRRATPHSAQATPTASVAQSPTFCCELCLPPAQWLNTALPQCVSARDTWPCYFSSQTRSCAATNCKENAKVWDLEERSLSTLELLVHSELIVEMPRGSEKQLQSSASGG